MADEVRPIIKRKKVISGGGHHGGAWKVAYADFVTAMMAFFMLMWLLNATTEKQRKGLADYFSPTIPITRISGGGDGMFGGDSMFSEEALIRNGTGGTTDNAGKGSARDGSNGSQADEAARAAEDARLQEVIEGLAGKGGDSLKEELSLKHVQTKLTDEGVVIEVFAVEDAPLFVNEVPTELTLQLVAMIAEAASWVINDIAVEGHLPTPPIVMADKKTWEISSQRAHILRELLIDAGLSEARFRRVTGHGDRDHGGRAPFDVTNNRLEVILLRSDI